MIIKGYKPLRQWLSNMESKFSVSRKKTCVNFPLLYILAHPRITNFFSFSSCLNPSTHVLTKNNATLWKKKLGENMKRFSETSTRLPIKHFRKKLVQKILNGFGHTDVREIILSKKIRLHINWVAGSQKKWTPSLTFYSFLKFWRQQNFTGWGVDFDKKQKA